MISIYPGVSRRCTLRRSVHLGYPWISIHPPSLINNVLRGCDRASWEMHLEAEIEWTQRYTWRPRSSELRDALGGRDWVNSEMHLETGIEWTQRCTGRLWSSEFQHALGGRDRVNSVMHSGPWLSEFRHALAGYGQARLEEYLEAVDWDGGATAAETLFIGWLVIVGM